MKVTVKLLGILGDLAKTAGKGPIELTLPPGATAADLLSQLSDRFGKPFGDLKPKVFVNGEFIPETTLPLAVSGSNSTSIQVLITNPISGG